MQTMYQKGHPVQLLCDLFARRHGTTAKPATRCSGPLATAPTAISTATATATATATLRQRSCDPESAATHAADLSDAPDATALTDAATRSTATTSEYVDVFNSDSGTYAPTGDAV